MIATLVAIPTLIKMWSLYTGRRHRKANNILGRYRTRDPVIIRTSDIQALRVEKQDGASHEVKSNLLDSYEIVGAFEIKKFLEREHWMASMDGPFSRGLRGSVTKSPQVIIDIPESKDRVALVQACAKSSPVILIGSGVFNPDVNYLHGFPEIARIELARDEKSDLREARWRKRHLLLPGEGSKMQYTRLEKTREDDKKPPVYEDYALVQSIKVKHPKSRHLRTYWVLAGLGRGGTGAAVRYFLENWDELDELSGENPNGFTIVLRWRTSDFSLRPHSDDVEPVDLSGSKKPQVIELKTAESQEKVIEPKTAESQEKAEPTGTGVPGGSTGGATRERF